MPEYDFTSLSPHDFELLTRDLLQAELGVHIESFKSGRDKGIDLRYARDSKRQTIVQCKHYVKTGLAGLKSHLARNEKPKVDALSPPSYRLATSVSLSAQNKSELVAVLAPHVQGPEDIMGAEDLNNLLGKHPEVERKHFKLWIGSTAVLRTILTNDVFSRSYIDARQIRRRLSLFVPTPALDRARQILDQRGFCLISGVPGIGKTTTAEMLVVLALEKGWEATHLTGGVDEAFRTFDPKVRQLFFYDDFLGRTSLRDNPMRKNEDRDLVRLLQYCEQNKGTKQAILTTREYILAQARQGHEILSQAPIEIANCIVSLEDYTSAIRTEILINHLYFYDVPDAVRRYLVHSGGARQIVAHKNYSPRIVEWMCDAQFRHAPGPEEFSKLFLESLDDPSELWNHAFENQISPDARELLLGVATLGDGCDPDALYSTVLAYRGVTEARHEHQLGLRKALAELEGSFLRIDADGRESVVRFHNPSVKDFTDKLLLRERTTAQAFLASAPFFEQVVHILKSAGNARDLIDDQLFCQKVGETYAVRSPLFEQVQSARRPMLLRRRSSASQRLLQALSLAEKRSSEAQVAVARLAASYLQAPDASWDTGSEIADLYRSARSILVAAGQSVDVTARSVVERVREELRDIEGFTALRGLLDESADEDLMAQLTEDFLAFAEVDLAEAASRARSSTEIADCISAVMQAAEEFGVEGSIELDAAQAALGTLTEREEFHADMYKENVQSERYAKRVESETVDEMLHSLLE